ncbi:MAG: hypothetical protein ABSC63_10720 [Candidatus Binataceae bacterium]|jgi:hypothetical protein
MVLGLLCAGVVLAVGRFEWWRAGGRLEALETTCKAQGLPPPPPGVKFVPSPPPGFKVDKPVMSLKGTAERSRPSENDILAAPLKDPDFGKLSPQDKVIAVQRILATRDKDFAKLSPADQLNASTKILQARGVDLPIPVGATIDPLADAKRITDWDFVCDGEELHRLADEHPLSGIEPLSGIQDEIEQTFNRRQQNWENTSFWALILAVALSLPRVWYFLLGRIGELSAAIRGTPRP